MYISVCIQLAILNNKRFLLFFHIISFIFFNRVHAQDSTWTLKQCIDTALKYNITVQKYNHNHEISSVTLKQSKANLYPNFQINANQLYGSGRTLNPGNYQFTNDNIWSNNFSVSSTVTLFNGFRNTRIIKQNELLYESSGYETENIRNEISLAIINTYLQILLIKELIANSEKQIETTTAQMNQTNELVKIGLRPEADLIQWKAQLATDNLTLIRAKGQFNSAKILLQQQMNIPFTPGFDIAYTVIPETEPVIHDKVENIYSAAISTQPIIKSYYLKSQAAAYGVKIARSSLYPYLALSFNAGTTYSSVSRLTSFTTVSYLQNIGYLQSNPGEVVLGTVTNNVLLTEDYPFWKQLRDFRNSTLTLSLTIPVFNRMQTYYNIQRQSLLTKIALLDEEEIKLNLRKNIEQAYVDAENAIAALEGTEEQLHARQVSYGNAQARYENGLINIIDLLNEKNKLFIAESEHLQAKYELLFRMKILDYYRGVPIEL